MQMTPSLRLSGVMGTRKYMHRAAIAAVVLLAACGGGNESGVSDQCHNAFADAAEAQDADDELHATLAACSTYDEWLQGLRDQPAALGLTDRATIEGSMEVETVCFGADGPVCDDARQRGIID